MLARLIKWLETKLKEFETHKKHAGVESKAEPQGRGVVMRFQGRYDCGHEWPKDVIAPESCPLHGEGCNRVYRPDEVVEFTGHRVSTIE